MRLAQHSLKKGASSHKRQVKHSPKKLGKIVRQQEKAEKKSEMAVEDNDDDAGAETTAPPAAETAQATIAKHNAKMERKKHNAGNLQYKKLNTAISNKKGPRAVSG
jgi:FKBP-type peptidyl-prolyl cis-trans isomerase